MLRLVPIEEPLLRDCSDYLSDVNREEIYDKLAGAGTAGAPRPLTVIVYQNGDQINLFRIVDRDATSPLSESLRYVYVTSPKLEYMYHKRL